MAIKLTETTAATITVPEGKRDVVIFDAVQPGLFLRKFATGKAIYGAKYYVAGKERKVHLHDVPALNATDKDKAAKEVARHALASARKEAGDLRAKARLGTDVIDDREKMKAAKAEDEKRAVNTLGFVVEKYLAARETGENALRPRSYLEVKRHLEQHWKALHDRPIHSITRDDVLDHLQVIEQTAGAVTRDRCKSSLGTLFVWALDHRPPFVNSTPVAFVKRKVSKRRGNRKRTLTAGELREIWHATDAVDDEGRRLVNNDYATIVKLAILTGQRRTELGGLDQREIFENGASGHRIELPEARTKNGLPHAVPLAPQAAALLPAKRNSTTKLFGRFDKGYTGWSKAKKELDAAILANRRKADPKAAPMPAWVLHDTRRTLSTQLKEQGFADAHLCELILNHTGGTRGGVAGDYDKSERFAGRRKALAAWAEHVDKLVS
jgi:integrase